MCLICSHFSNQAFIRFVADHKYNNVYVRVCMQMQGPHLLPSIGSQPV
jgi:hypothetical protein